MAEQRMFEVGERVQSTDGSRATVRYVGSVTGATPEDGWVGLEWDTVGRGKHNGSAKGVRYFECQDGCGSFVRPDAVLVPSTTFQDALILKYASEDAANVDDAMSFREAAGKKKAIVCELVGTQREIKRMAKTELLEEVTLPQAAIAGAGDQEWLKQCAGGITSLELDDNLFRDWDSVAGVTRQLLKLHTISLNGNRLEPITCSPSAHSLLMGAFSSLTKLVLNATGANFAQIELVKSVLPQLTDLHMASNNISAIDCSTQPGSANDSFEGWPSLKLIDLSDNLLTSWDRDVVKLAKFSRLQKLILNGNKIESISIPKSTKDEASEFGELTLLAVANNQVQTWASIDCLQGLGKLAEMRVQGNPFAEGMRPGAVRQLLIAKVPSLKIVNGGEVRPRERVEAEKFYVRHCIEEGKGRAAAELAKDDHVFAEYLLKHGEPAIRPVAAGGVGASLIQVTLKSMAADSSHKPPVSRKLPGGMTVANVKRMCQQLFNLDMGKQKLFWQETGVKDVWEAEEMDDDLKPVCYYITSEECDVLMQEADLNVVQGEAEERARKQQESEAKLAAQVDALSQVQRGDVYAAKQAASAAAVS